MIRCQTCKVERDESLYVHKQSGKTTSNCEKCRNNVMRSKLKRDGAFYDNNRRNSNFKAMYGITLEEYDRMFAEQDGKCSICGNTHSTIEGKKLAVDHDHKTNKVRALLCSGCNQGLGYFKDDPELMQKALAYLNKFRAKEDM